MPWCALAVPTECAVETMPSPKTCPPLLKSLLMGCKRLLRGTQVARSAEGLSECRLWVPVLWAGGAPLRKPRSTPSRKEGFSGRGFPRLIAEKPALWAPAARPHPPRTTRAPPKHRQPSDVGFICFYFNRHFKVLYVSGMEHMETSMQIHENT